MAGPSRFRSFSAVPPALVAAAAVLAAAAAASVTPAAALARPASFSSSGPAGSGPPGGGGGGGKVAINDLEGLRSDRLTWSTSLVRETTKRTRTCDPKLAMCRVGQLIMVPPTTSAGYGQARGGFPSYMAGLRSQIGLRNRCHVERDVLHSLDLSRGCWFSPSTSTGARWGEIHPKVPVDGAMPGVQGDTSHLIVRVWRSCRLDEGRDDFTTSGSPAVSVKVSDGGRHCSTDPIYERTVAPKDNLARQSLYFHAGRADEKLLFGGSTAFGALGRGGTAGVLFADCFSRGWYPAGTYNRLNDYCTSPAHNTGSGEGSTFYPRCSANNLNGHVVWSPAEAQGELAYRLNTRDSWWRSRQNSLQDWIGTRAAGDGSVWPNSINSASERNKLCADASEWLAVRWHLPQGEGDRATATVRLNGVPGRLYLVQLVWLDSRQDVLRQDLDLVSSAASLRPTQRCDNPATPEVEQYPLGDKRCFEEFLRTQQATGSTSFSFARTSVVGALVTHTIDAQPTFAEPLDDLDADTSGYSLDLPRAAAVGTHNPQPFTTGAEDPNGGFAGGATGLAGSFADLEADERARGAAHWPFVVRTGDADVARELTNPFYGGLVPLLNGAEGRYAVSWGIRAADPTASGCAPKPSYGLPYLLDPCTAAERARLEHTNTAAVLWENRRAVGDWKADAPAVRQTQRLTCDRATPNAPKMLGFPQGPRDGLPCDPNRPLGDGFYGRDAYTVPPLSAGTEVELAGLFDQAADGEASLSLDGPLAGRVVEAHLYTAEDYANRAAVGPDYVVGPGGGGTISFCQPELRETITEPGDPMRVEHWLDQWGDSAYGPGQQVDHTAYRAYFTTAKWAGGDLPGIGHFSADVAWYRYRNSRGETAYTHTKPKTKPSSFLGYGRSWWFSSSDKGPGTLYRAATRTVSKPNPACPPGIRAVSAMSEQQATDLPAGTYVVVFKIAGATPASERWGIVADVLANPTMQWGVQYRIDRAYDWTRRYRARAVA